MLDLISQDSFSFVPLATKPISLTWLLLDFGSSNNQAYFADLIIISSLEDRNYISQRL